MHELQHQRESDMTQVKSASCWVEMLRSTSILIAKYLLSPYGAQITHQYVVRGVALMVTHPIGLMRCIRF